MPRALPVLPATFALEDIEIASPCPADWEGMVGGDRVRFCASCQKNVFNLSGMPRAEAMDLLRATEGRICVRLFRRADGTVLTEDCPVGMALVLRRAKRATRAAAAVALGAVAGLLAFVGGSFTQKTCTALRVQQQAITLPVEDEEPTPALQGAPLPSPVSPEMGGARPTMGATMGEAAPFAEVKGKMAMPRPQPVAGRMKIRTKAPEARAMMGDVAIAPPPGQE